MPLYYCEHFHSNICSCFVTPNVTQEGKAFSLGWWVEQSSSCSSFTVMVNYKSFRKCSSIKMNGFLFHLCQQLHQGALLPWYHVCHRGWLSHRTLWFIKKGTNCSTWSRWGRGMKRCRGKGQPNCLYPTRHMDCRITARFPQGGTHRMSLRKDLEDHWALPAPPQNYVPKCHTPFESFQGWWLQNSSGQPVPVPDSPFQWKKTTTTKNPKYSI